MTDRVGEVYLNGRFLPLSEAHVSVMDRGFLFGDGVYEVIPAFGGHPFRLQHHLARLRASLAAVRITSPMDEAEWKGLVHDLLDRAGAGDHSIYLQVTRGADGKRDHSYPHDLKPTVLAMSRPLTGPSPELLTKGLKACILEDIRWARCDIKSISLLANIMLLQQAKEAGAEDAILVRNGLALEGIASSLFIMRNGVLRTPPKGPFLLPGVTRDLVLELAAAHGMAFEVADITTAELKNAEEIWLTSSTREIVPVTFLDTKPVGQGKPGRAWDRMNAWYQDCKTRLRMGLQAC